MFNFTHVLNATTGQRYYIDKATLANDEGYDETPDGVNIFNIDLQPERVDDAPICGVSLVVYNRGRVDITRDLDVEHSVVEGTNEQIIVEALIEGKTLIITNSDKEVQPE